MVPTPISPPGTANWRWLLSACSETIRLKIGLHSVPTLRVFCNDAGSNLNLLTEPQNAGEDRATSNTTFQIVNLGTGFVDVE
jgi:hypothetical protein